MVIVTNKGPFYKDFTPNIRVSLEIFILTSNCICKDRRNEIEAPNPVVKNLISFKIMKRSDKKAKLIHNAKTTIFVKYPNLPYRESALLFFSNYIYLNLFHYA